MEKTWLLIPAFDEAASIKKVIDNCSVYCKDIVIVDDGSADDTAGIAEKAGVIVLRHETNKGKGEALKTGFQWLIEKGCGPVITLDGDGQHDPSMIPAFFRRYERHRQNGGGDIIIIGKRERERMPRYRAIPNKIGETMISFAARKRIQDTQSGYRLYSRGVIEKVSCRTGGFEMETELLIKASRMGARIDEIPVPTIYQENYKTHFRPVADFYRISIVFLRHFL